MQKLPRRPGSWPYQIVRRHTRGVALYLSGGNLGLQLIRIIRCPDASVQRLQQRIQSCVKWDGSHAAQAVEVASLNGAGHPLETKPDENESGHPIASQLRRVSSLHKHCSSLPVGCMRNPFPIFFI
jgi:hypothetical protein